MLQSFLFELKDHRRAQGKRYQQGHILLFSILGILSGATSYRKIAKFIKVRYDMLDELFELGWKRRPAYTTIRDIIQGTSPEELENKFRNHAMSLVEESEEHQSIGCDGKVLRGSFDKFNDQKAIQILSVFLNEGKLILAHAEIEAKTNEIPTAQYLMEELGLTDKIFTFDALHCQKKTLQVAKETGNDAIAQVKGNQKTLHEDCQRIAKKNEPDDVYQEPMTKTRNRIESRTASVFFYPMLTHFLEWGLVKAIVEIDRYRKQYDTKQKCWIETHETAYYISTIDLSAERFCQVIRDHWGIENRNHHVRDVTLLEDRSRIRVNPHLFAKLRSFALNILRKNGVTNVSMALFENCLDFQNVLNYSGIF